MDNSKDVEIKVSTIRGTLFDILPYVCYIDEVAVAQKEYAYLCEHFLDKLVSVTGKGKERLLAEAEENSKRTHLSLLQVLQDTLAGRTLNG